MTKVHKLELTTISQEQAAVLRLVIEKTDDIFALYEIQDSLIEKGLTEDELDYVFGWDTVLLEDK